MRVEIKLTDSLFRSIQAYYEQAKKQKQKAESARKSQEELLARLEKLKKEEEIVQEKAKMQEKRPKFWFEKFVWSLSTNGHLIIAGRDATTNELLIKRYLEKDDLVFHTNIQGAAFVILKQGSKAKEVDMEDAAQIAACFSKAWKEGFASIDVYSIKPTQISKTPNPGEYLAKGSFVIRGERKWYRNVPLILNFGFLNISKITGDDEDIYLPAPGSFSALKKNSESDIFQITQGRMKKGDASKKLHAKYYSFLKNKKISYISLDDYIKQLPPGDVSIHC